MGCADGKPAGGRACGSFGLLRGSVIEPFEPANGHSAAHPQAACVNRVTAKPCPVHSSLHATVTRPCNVK